MAWHGRYGRQYVLLVVAIVRLTCGSSYNDCHRHGPPDLSSTPSWNGQVETFFDDWRPLADIDRFVDELSKSNPELVTLKTIGQSWQGRSLRVMEITSGGVSGDKPLIYLEGGIHAREWIATSTVLYQAYTLVTKAKQGNAPVMSMLRDYTFAILSPVNPDGYKYTWEADRFWRKTRSDREHCGYYADQVAGVDPNRNWGFTRGITGAAPGGTSESSIVNPCLETFEGPAAFSEPEVLSVANYLRQRQNSSFTRSSRDAHGTLVPGPGYVAVAFDYHSYAQMLLPPWGYSALWPAAPDHGYMSDLCVAMAAAIKAVNGNTFTTGPDILPADPGTMPDWVYGELGVRATMTVELESRDGNGSFCISKDTIRPVGEEQFEAIVTVVNYIREKGGTPSSLFGMYVGSPPAPPIQSRSRLWLQGKVPYGGHISAVCGLGFGIVVFFAGALSFLRLKQLRQGSTSDYAHYDFELE